MGRVANWLGRRLPGAAIYAEPEVREVWQPWWNLAGVPGLISAQAYQGSSNIEQALRNAASWACIDVLADAIARTPVDVFRDPGPSRTPVVPIPPIIAKPSGMVQPDVWRYQLAWSMLTDGNAFGIVQGLSTRGWPNQIELINPTTVTERKVVNGKAQCKYDGDVRQLWPFGDIWHVPGRMIPAGSPFGLSPIYYAAKTIGTSLSAEDFSYSFFTDGGHPSAILHAKGPMTPEEGQAVKDAWRRATRGGNREPAIMGSDLAYERIQTNPAETAFIDLQRFEIEQACRFWRVPPSMVYAAVSGEAVTYANVTESDLNFLKHSLDGYYVRLDTAYTDLLPRPQYAKANRNAILRADVKARNETYSIQLANRTLTVNEVRGYEDQPPFKDPAFDVPGVPPINAPLDVAAMVRNMVQGVGVMLTAEEARQILNDLGAGLPILDEPFNPEDALVKANTAPAPGDTGNGKKPAPATNGSTP